MFVLRSTHKALLQEKDAIIADLREQVRFLRFMVQPSPAVQVISEEANAVLDGHNEPSLTPEQIAIQEEASRLLSGTY